MGTKGKVRSISRGLPAADASVKVSRPPSQADVVNAQGDVDFSKLAAALRRDRLRLKKTWPAYALHMQLPQSTLYKITRLESKPHELTVQKILDRWAEALPDDGGSAARGGDDVVSGR